MNEIEAKRISQARARLLAIAPFFGAPSLRLRLRENTRIPTLQTDGTNIDYNPEYTRTKTVGQLTFLVAHETGHCLLLHPYRVGNRNLHLANVAGDYCINEMLQNGGFEMPDGLLRDVKYDGMGMETVYSILYREQEQERERHGGQERNGGTPGPSDDSGESESDEDEDGEPQSGDKPSDSDDESDDDEGQEQSGSGSDESDDESDEDAADEGEGDDSDESGEAEDADEGDEHGNHFVPAPQPTEAPGEDDEAEAIEGQESASEKPLTADDWKKIAEQAVMIQRKAGKLPVGADRAVEAARQSEVDWVAALKEFIVNTVPTGQDWTHPDRRFVAAGTYMPGNVKENTPPLAVAIDASGSIGQELLAKFLAELNSIANEVRPERIDVVSFDSEVTNVDSFDPDEEVTFDPKGGGGTYFNPVLVDWLSDMSDEGQSPAALIFATDLDCADIPVEPDVPVLWLVPSYVRRDGPFGITVHMPVGVRD